MTNLRGVVIVARDRLIAAAIEDAAIEAELLLRHALGLDRAAFYRDAGRELSATEAEAYEALLQRRLAHEPSAYITGHREFYGLDFAVTPDVLIPRPETETLVEAAIGVLKQASTVVRGPLDARPAGPARPGIDIATATWLGADTVARVEAMRDAQAALRIADVGTGSGAIAVSLATRLGGVIIHATDTSAAALAVAKGNAARHHVEGRVRFQAGDLLAPLGEPIDLVVANLPYVRTADWRELPPELREHEPRLALDGGEDGLDIIRRLFDQLPRHLSAAGAVCLEFGDGQADAIEALARDQFATTHILPDLAGRPCVLVAR